MTIMKKLVESAREDSQFWFGHKEELVNSEAYYTLCMLGEAGELANLIKKVERGTHKREDLLPEMQEELVDVFVYLLNLAGLLDVDLVEGYVDKKAKNERRFGNGY